MRRRRSLEAGTTLNELITAAAVTGVIMAVACGATFSIARSIGVAERTAREINDEVRVADYVARDLRSALSASLNNGVLTISLPDYFDGNSPRDPMIVDGKSVQYAAAPLTVRYFFKNGTVIREVNTAPTVIARNVATFSFNDQLPDTTPGTVFASSRIKSTSSLTKVAIQLKRSKSPTN